jgi:hypothetical protein
LRPSRRSRAPQATSPASTRKPEARRSETEATTRDRTKVHGDRLSDRRRASSPSPSCPHGTSDLRGPGGASSRTHVLSEPFRATSCGWVRAMLVIVSSGRVRGGAEPAQQRRSCPGARGRALVGGLEPAAGAFAEAAQGAVDDVEGPLVNGQLAALGPREPTSKMSGLAFVGRPGSSWPR